MLITKAVAELLGSFFFYSIILLQGQPIPVAAALLAACYFAGGAYNPAVSIMQLISNKIDALECFVFIVAQLAAAVLAIVYARSSFA